MLHEQPGAKPTPAPSEAKHMRRLVADQTVRRSTRIARRASRGQTLIIFVLSFTILVGFIGLAIDSIRIYDLYARMQRAAEAGALAGVIYMPDYYTADVSTSPNDNAVCRAQKEVYKNFFNATGAPCTDAADMGANYCPANPSSVEVAVCQVSGQQYQLKVFVTEPINVLFLSALNIGPLTLTASATAAFNPPISLAVDPLNPGGTSSLGTIPFCNGVNCNGRPWGMNINGPAELKEQGDPFVTCEEGNANTQVQDSSALSYTTYTGWQTNHPIYSQSVGTPPSNCTTALSTPFASQSAYLTANPDAPGQPFTGADYSGNNAPTHTGYSYYVEVQPNQTGNAFVYNAPFAPQTPTSCNGRQWTIDSFFPCPYGTYTNYPGSDYATLGFQDPKLYFTVTYSVYKLNNGPADPTNVTYLGAFTALPYYTGGKCATELLPSAEYHINSASCVTSQCVSAWCPIGNQTGDTTAPTAISLPGGTSGASYRITVVSASYYDQGFDLGWGQHGYGLELCTAGADPTSSTSCNGAAVGGISSWSTMDALFLFPGKGQGNAQHTGVPLGVFSSQLAGRTIDIGLFDPGDTFGVNGALDAVTGFAVVPTLNGATDPCLESAATLQAAGYDTTVNGRTFNFPAWETSTTMDQIASAPAIPGISTSDTNGHNRAYNGLWAHEEITLPANYTETPWNICAWGPGVDRDLVGISATTLGQSPVHLIQ